MAARAVHWHEGMFLRPHHFQAVGRYQAHQTHLTAQWGQHYSWGLRSIKIDRQALANHRLVIDSLSARLHDGTLLVLPEDGTLPELDLRAPFERDRAYTVLLALPKLDLGRANVSAKADAEGAAEGGRYRVEKPQPTTDENTGDNPQLLDLRSLNVRLLLSTPTREHPGYDLLPVARLIKSGDSDNTPQLDPHFIPPLLACDAWKVLKVNILRRTYDRIGAKIEELVGQIASREITLGSQGLEEARIVGYLQALNEAYALLGILVYAKGIHPLHAYLELCRLVGQLAIFGAGHRPPKLPRYDHDNLGRCFYAVKRHLDDLLKLMAPPQWKKKPFVGVGKRMQVQLEEDWLLPGRELYIGVESELAVEECVRLLTPRGQLDMKIGSGDRVDELYNLRQAGLAFRHNPEPPLPGREGLVYFEIDRKVQPAEWQKVTDSLAVRLNENRIEDKINGTIEGKKALKISLAGGKATTMHFTLFVVWHS